MKRSEINKAVSDAQRFFKNNSWTLPPNPRWDVTDFSLGNFSTCGLVLVNLAEEEEYCEKVMYAIKNQVTPSHTHKRKKEDIICRTGTLIVRLWADDPEVKFTRSRFPVKINGINCLITSGDKITLQAGNRVTIESGVWHEFYPESDECIIGEVSTANDDLNDNFFSNQEIGRYTEIIEDETRIVKLLSED
ncbi:MAG: D-lyxose/D-mannose family sugar isomerase [Pedobacter sp.]|nr:MAG: D-lyxose/D-mannose family sugar isomerase [Pedobacter sp.]